MKVTGSIVARVNVTLLWDKKTCEVNKYGVIGCGAMVVVLWLWVYDCMVYGCVVYD